MWESKMNENQIHCPKCGVSWLIWENIDDTIDIDNGDWEMNEFRCYICPKCDHAFDATVYFTKRLKEIKYH